jgi:hypothetical protein
MSSLRRTVRKMANNSSRMGDDVQFSSPGHFGKLGETTNPDMSGTNEHALNKSFPPNRVLSPPNHPPPIFTNPSPIYVHPG